MLVLLRKDLAAFLLLILLSQSGMLWLEELVG